MTGVTVRMRCEFCGCEHSVKADALGYHRWQNGELIQNALGYLTATEREQLISKICPKCQESIFGSDEEEE